MNLEKYTQKSQEALLTAQRLAEELNHSFDKSERAWSTKLSSWARHLRRQHISPQWGKYMHLPPLCSFVHILAK